MFLPKFGYLGYFCKIEKLYKKYLTNNLQDNFFYTTFVEVKFETFYNEKL